MSCIIVRNYASIIQLTRRVANKNEDKNFMHDSKGINRHARFFDCSRDRVSFLLRYSLTSLTLKN